MKRVNPVTTNAKQKKKKQKETAEQTHINNRTNHTKRNGRRWETFSWCVLQRQTVVTEHWCDVQERAVVTKPWCDVRGRAVVAEHCRYGSLVGYVPPDLWVTCSPPLARGRVREEEFQGKRIKRTQNKHFQTTTNNKDRKFA